MLIKQNHRYFLGNISGINRGVGKWLILPAFEIEHVLEELLFRRIAVLFLNQMISKFDMFIHLANDYISVMTLKTNNRYSDLIVNL